MGWIDIENIKVGITACICAKKRISSSQVIYSCGRAKRLMFVRL